MKSNIKDTGKLGLVYSFDEDRNFVFMHDLLMQPIPAGKHVGHLNGDVLDNRTQNLAFFDAPVYPKTMAYLEKNKSKIYSEWLADQQ